ncbi:hypothetical protein EV426DRAFT_532723 [Tirmania nivea]|nr:hypothetical protein EV426DRAFT_532723 [Tirmania nivea]
MSSSNEDILFRALHTIRTTTVSAANALDTQIDFLADKLRGHLSNSIWLPKSYRPTSPPPPPPPKPTSLTLSFFTNPTHLFSSTSQWIRRNKLLTAALFSTLSIGTVKRRASRASNGARTQVIVLSGYPHEQTTSLLALDLERRGFIVFIIVHTPEEESSVLRGVGEGRPDIRPLMLELASPDAQMERFTNWLLSPQSAFEGAGKGGRYHLNLVGLVVIPALTSYQARPVEILDGGVWSDTININLLQPVIVARNFLRPLSLFKSRLVVLQSVIVPPLAPPFCALETVVGRAIEGWVEVLEREVSPFGVGVALVKVGNVEGILGAAQLRPSSFPNSIPINPGARADVLTWPAPLRQSYGRQYISTLSHYPSSASSARGSTGIKGVPIRELYITVFDALGAGMLPGQEKRKGRFLYRVGTGSRLYEFIGDWLPRGFVGWMLGVSGWGTVEVPRESRRVLSGLIGHGEVVTEKGKEKEGGVPGPAGGAATPEWEKVDKML